MKWLVVAGACALAACSDLTKVTSLGIVQPTSELNATGAAAWFNGAVRIFTQNFSNAVSTSGTFVDEIYGTDYIGNDGEGFLTDARRPFTPGFPTTRSSNFTSFNLALQNLREALDALRTYAPTPASRIGQMLAFTGYTEMLLAEEYCNGIPLSQITPEGTVTYSSGVTTPDLYARAIAHFDSAATAGADTARILNLARVGRGRALLDVGRYADAATAVNAVPTSFVWNPEYSTNTSIAYNVIFANTNVSPSSRYKSVADRDGGVGLNFVSAKDPRVPTVYIGFGNDGVSPLYGFAPFTSYASTMTLASGTEARLIEAEAALQANHNDANPTGSGWLGILNSLRASSTGLAPLADPGSYDARVDLLFRERAFWMFLTTHRMSDVRRLVRQYGRAVNTVYPSGNWKDGLPYGTEVVFDVPLSEASNPKFTACKDKNP